MDQQTVNSSSSASRTWDNRNKIPLTNSLFTWRSFNTTTIDGKEQASIESGRLAYELPGTPATSDARGYIGVNYTSASPVNLLGSGDNAFLVKFDFFHSSVPYGFYFYVGDPRLQDPYNKFSITDFRSGSVSSGTVLIPFSYFTHTDLAQVSYLGIDGSRLPAGTSFIISSITTVPEPDISMLVCGLTVALGFFRRRPQPTLF